MDHESVTAERVPAELLRIRDERTARIWSRCGLGLWALLGVLAWAGALAWSLAGFVVLVLGAVDLFAPHRRRLRRAWAETHQDDSIELGPGWAGSLAYSIFGRRQANSIR